MSKLVLTNLDFNNVSRIRNLPSPANSDEPATRAYVDAAIEGLAWKDSVRVASAGNLNLASPGASIDGVTLAANDRVLVMAQTVQSENGLYVWNGAAIAMTRSADASTAAELEQAVVSAEEGTSAGASYRQTQVNFTLGTNPVIWTSFATAAPAATETVSGIAEIATQAETDAGTDDARFVTPLKLKTSVYAAKRYATTFGDGSATQFNITHNFNSRDVAVTVYRISGAYDEVLCDVERGTVNTVTLRFASAPAANEFRCVIIG